MKDFNGKVAFITGAGSGMGNALANAAAKKGMKLALLDANRDSLNKAVASLRKKGAEVEELIVDVTQEKNVDRAIDETIRRFGKIDLLVNCAGVSVSGPVWTLPARDWEWILHVDFMSQVYAMKKVIPIMMGQEDGGDILNFASITGLISGPGFLPAYYSTKFAVVGLSESVAWDLQAAKLNKIHMHVFCPATVHTHLNRSESYRPSQYADKSDPYYKSKDFKAGQAAANKDIANGMPLEKVPGIVFDGLEKNDFYILAQKQYNPLIIKRAEQIVSQKQPSLAELQKLMSQGGGKAFSNK